MRRFLGAFAAASLAFGCGATGRVAGEPRVEPLTIDRILEAPSLAGSSPSSLAWSPDGARLAFLWSDPRRPGRRLWIVDADGSGLRSVTAEGERVGRFAWMPDGASIVYLRGDELWATDLEGATERLAGGLDGASDLRTAPDGRHVSLLKDGDLWLFEVASRSLERVTDVGVPSISNLSLGRYSRPDVEIGSYVWGGPTYAWSPDGRTIAVHHVDRRGVRAVPFPDYIAEETAPNLVRRNYPGDPNEARTVGFVDVASGALRLLDLPSPESNRVVDFSWSPDGRLLLDRESDTAVDRWIHIVDTETGEMREVWSHRRESRVYTLAGSAWHPDGERVVFLSDLDDRYGLYVWSEGASEPERITPEDFDVTAPPEVVPGPDGAIYFQSNEPNPYERHVHRITAGGGVGERITTRAGESVAVPSPDGRSVALLHSSDNTPTELYMIGPDGGPERRVTVSPSADFAVRPWAEVRYATFPSQVDGVALHARILEPRGLDRTRRHPVLFGPVYSNTVRNRWGGRYALIQQVLVERGFIVVQVDVRGSTGYGRAFREGFLMDFAGKDLEDLESAVRHMESLPHVDPDRIGVWGSSYGGLMTIFALLKKPGLFEAGVAGAAAVDPYFFGGDDVAIVRRPGTHPEAFVRGAAQYAGNLEDHLLIIHGMQDQVVPFKTTVALAEELIQHGKDFDFAFAPRGTHGWTGPPRYARYLLGKLVQHFERHLGGGGAER